MSQEAARPYIGGQAVIEGVMMRSPSSLSIVCRRRSGELVVREQPAAKQTQGPHRWPFVRGVMTLVESMRLGSRALRWSAELYERDMEEAEKDATKLPPPSASSSGGFINAFTALSLMVSAVCNIGPDAAPPAEKKSSALSILPVVFAILLFVAAPQAAAEGVNKLFGLNLAVTAPLFQAITGAAKLTIVISYLLLIRRVAEVRRVFQYHGAEHKAISTYEAQEELTVPNAKAKTTLHARCGTTFLVMVALVSILVFSFAGALFGAILPPLPGGRAVESISFFGLKLLFLPVLAGITFEIQRLFARYCSVGPLRILLWPGFLVQKITTAEPSDDQLEVALASLRATLWREATEEAPAPPDRVFSDYKTLLADPGYAKAG